MLNFLFVNIFFCLIILLYALWVYSTNKSLPVLLIGLALGVFGLSHSISLFEIPGFHPIIFIIGEVIGYILILWGIAILAQKKK